LHALRNQRQTVDSFTSGKELKQVQVVKAQSTEEVEVGDKMIDVELPVSDDTFGYENIAAFNVLYHQYKRSVPFVSTLENGDDKIILSTFGSRIDVRKLGKDNTIEYLQTWPLSDDELISCLDSKRTDWDLNLAVGSTNGILYIFELMTINRVIFKNHSDKISSVRFNPIEDEHTIISISIDNSIRIFDYIQGTQLSVYQDAFNFWLAGRQVCWHHLGKQFMSFCDREGQDLIHFWYTPDHEFHNQFPEVERHVKQFLRSKQKMLNLSDSEEEDTDRSL
jgi:WD40 repeat protein